jgi:hypothetical protein
LVIFIHFKSEYGHYSCFISGLETQFNQVKARVSDTQTQLKGGYLQCESVLEALKDEEVNNYALILHRFYTLDLLNKSCDIFLVS